MSARNRTARESLDWAKKNIEEEDGLAPIYKDDIITHRIGGPTCLAEKEEEEAPRSGDFSL